ncbi:MULTISPECIES: hypothetical protein [Acinetobacter]|jgi:hypothetical protein|uniref:Uncharacterized protein n=1 Tax=Acinetobacter radioresistens TaxID=40216 RepID=A0A8H2PVA2_ACIRA|nr:MULTISPECIES: hypothetical protein [Acinetobacter]ENV88398.1 hypothetical protein F939_02023 [Acinetobacter radioresistens DSM 6976 = NBRC 102413 = CIP 103788]MCK4102149.1 hypothetical protein [Acinetobacter radioresistens]MCM1934755.1 hypothetical protein [Acinetobacter radioresistens]MCM1952381.1 hypothetical protein [Acinetobacter radioresistens]MCU4309542.1 hypothetical protein [Acinetobacter radioresistens]
MLYQYHCACCNKVVSSTEKECPACGSHSIRSPFGFWMFCITACLAVVMTITVVQVYFQDHQDVPVQTTLLDVLNHDRTPAHTWPKPQ